MIDSRALQMFLAVCQAQSIIGAARKLHVSQPSVSVAMARLERQLGTALLERSRNGVRLTRAGVALRRRAEAMDALLRDAKAEAVLANDDILGPLRIGGTPGALFSLVPKAVAQLEASGIRLTLSAVERPDGALTEALRTREVELAFVTTGIDPAPDDIEERACARDPFDLVVGRANEHLPSTMSLRDAAGLRWLLPDAAGAFRRQIDALFIAADVHVPRDVVRCDSLMIMKEIVRQSSHVTILPRRVVAAEVAIGVLRSIALADVNFHRTIGVRLLRQGPRSRLAELLLAKLPTLEA